MSTESKWRIGSKVPINVYEGERPICQCHTAIDAKRIVDAVNMRGGLLEALEILFDITPFAANDKDAEIRVRVRAVINKARGQQ